MYRLKWKRGSTPMQEDIAQEKEIKPFVMKLILEGKDNPDTKFIATEIVEKPLYELQFGFSTSPCLESSIATTKETIAKKKGGRPKGFSPKKAATTSTLQNGPVILQPEATNEVTPEQETKVTTPTPPTKVEEVAIPTPTPTPVAILQEEIQEEEDFGSAWEEDGVSTSDIITGPK